MKPTQEENPSYRAWYPAIESKMDMLSVLLTPAREHQAPITGRRFAAEVATAAGLEVEPVLFRCEGFATLYFGGEGEKSARWRECWDMRLMLPDKVGKRSVKTMAAYPIHASPDSTGEVHEYIPFRVIADFTSRKLAIACRNALRERAHAGSIRWSDRYAIRDVAARHQQLCIDLTTVLRSELDALLPDARTIMGVCEEMGGRVSPPPE
ncbi:MAG TPA: hypothetical protein VF625_04075 [Longimicrobium sp.]|jgi:hypothetical protein